MNEPEVHAILTLCVMAAFADSDKHERERDEIKRIAQALMDSEQVNLAPIYQDVLLKRVSVAQVAAQLTSTEDKLLAYEMAVCACDADGAQSALEQAFLLQLSAALGLGAHETAAIDQRAQTVASIPAVTLAAATVPAIAVAAEPVAADADAAIDASILRSSILNGALELLPESISTMAIIPLQTRLVYQIGKSYGYELDTGHIRDFIATAGVGLTAQYLEQVGRKLLGGLLGKMIGAEMVRGVGKQALSSGMGFASTYALGHVAKRYYAGGRQLSTAMLKQAFTEFAGAAKSKYSQYLPQIQEQARHLNSMQLMERLRQPV